MIAGIGLINLLWHGIEKQESIPVDFRIYDKDTDGKRDCFKLNLGRQKQGKKNRKSAVYMK